MPRPSACEAAAHVPTPRQDPYGQCSSKTQVAACNPAAIQSAIMYNSRQPTEGELTHSSVPFSASPERKLGITHTTRDGLTLSRGPNGELRATIDNQSNDLGIGYVRKNGAYSTETHWTKIYDQAPGYNSRLNAIKMDDTYSLDVVHRGEGRTTLNVTMDRSVAAMKIQVGDKVYLLRDSDIKDLDKKAAESVPTPPTPVKAPLPQNPVAAASPAPNPPAVTSAATQGSGTVVPPVITSTPKQPLTRSELTKSAETARGEGKSPVRPRAENVKSEIKLKVEDPTNPKASEAIKEGPEVKAEPTHANEKLASNTLEIDTRTRTVAEQATATTRSEVPVREVKVIDTVAPTDLAPSSAPGPTAESNPVSPAEPAPAPDPRPGAESATRAASTGTAATSEGVAVTPTEPAPRTLTEGSSDIARTSPSAETPKVAESPSTAAPASTVSPEITVKTQLLEGLKNFNQNVKASEWARNNQFKAMTYTAAVSEAVTGAMKADYGPNDLHSPIPKLLTLLKADIQKGFEFTTEQGGLAASVAAEATNSAGNTTLAFGSFAALDKGLSAGSTTRVGQALGGRTAASAFSRTLGVVGVAYHGYSTFSDGGFVHQNDLQLAGNTASPVVMGAIIGAPLGPPGAAGGALLGAGSEAVGVAVGYSRLKGEIETDWKKREVREALRLAEEGFILPSKDSRVTSRKPFEQLPAEHQEVLTDAAKLATLARLTRELPASDLASLGFLAEPGQGASAEERSRVGSHNWERMIQLSEGRAGYNPYRLWAGDYLDEVRREHPVLAQTFDRFYSEAKDHYKNLYNHAPHVTFNVAADRVTADYELFKYISEVTPTILASAAKGDTLNKLGEAFPGIDRIVQNPNAREKLIHNLETNSGNTGRFRRLFDLEDLPSELQDYDPLTSVPVKKKESDEP